MSTSSRVPPFKSIEAFVVAARSLSFTDAASVLHITVPAVSRRIQSLETELGMSLFERRSRGLSLTDEGKTYLAKLEPALETIRRASDNVRVAAESDLIRISLPTSLAANWLVPRLHHFYRKHRGAQVQLGGAGQSRELECAGDEAALTHGDADVVIRLGSSNRPGLRSARLLDPEIFAVCSPTFLAGNRAPNSLEGLAELPLLGLKGQPNLWLTWFRSAGVVSAPHVDQEFDDAHLLYQAAASGLGVALGVDVLVQPYLDNNQLVRPFNSQFKLDNSYYVLWRAADSLRRPVSVFRDWLIAQGRGARGDLVSGRGHATYAAGNRAN